MEIVPMKVVLAIVGTVLTMTALIVYILGSIVENTINTFSED